MMMMILCVEYLLYYSEIIIIHVHVLLIKLLLLLLLLLLLIVRVSYRQLKIG